MATWLLSPDQGAKCSIALFHHGRHNQSRAASQVLRQRPGRGRQHSMRHGPKWRVLPFLLGGWTGERDSIEQDSHFPGFLSEGWWNSWEFQTDFCCQKNLSVENRSRQGKGATPLSLRPLQHMKHDFSAGSATGMGGSISLPYYTVLWCKGS